jgi:5-methylcytosine-specific restriction enzyme subunit McrC
VPLLNPDNPPAISVELTEWDEVGPGRNRRLEGISLAGDAAARALAKAVRSVLDIREGYEGLEIKSTSFVGRVDIGPLRIIIRPKLPSMPLARLLRYAYGLRDIRTIEETQAPTTRDGFHDLLIAMLTAETEELLNRGLARHYVSLTEQLESPRGRILVQELINQGGVRQARLPCGHYERRANWHLNGVLRAGLHFAAQTTEDRYLRRRAHRLAEMLSDVDLMKLDTRAVDQAERSLTRLTAAYSSALTIIRLLLDARGVAFERGGPETQIPGFLFDMNRFFQSLLSRFLREHLGEGRIEDERTTRKVFSYALDANPKCRKPPAPRPDFALIRKNGPVAFLDAKYRDVWERGFPIEWLYQLSIYSLASIDKVSVLLYASMSENARDERLEVRSPGQSSGLPASVILRPVLLSRMADLINPDHWGIFSAERRRWAEDLVTLRARTSAKMGQQGRGILPIRGADQRPLGARQPVPKGE